MFYYRQELKDTLTLVTDPSYEIIKMWACRRDLNVFYKIEWDAPLFLAQNPDVSWTEDISGHEIDFDQDYEFTKWDDYNSFLKKNTRKRIEAEVWDFYDLHADLSKRLAMIERLTIRCLLPIMKWEEVPEPFKTGYITLMENYLAMHEAWILKDRTDLEDANEVFVDLVTKNTLIADIVKEEYVDKKDL